MTLPIDLATALRRLRGHPRFAALAIGWLAVAIAVNAGAFALIHAFTTAGSPGVVEPAGLATVFLQVEESEGVSPMGGASLADVAIYERSISAFERVAASSRERITVEVGGEPQYLTTAVFTPGYFTLLGARAPLGSLALDMAGDRPVVAISHGLWQRSLGGAANVIGWTVRIAGAPFTIGAVLEAGFVGTHRGEPLNPDRGAPDVWIPLRAAAHAGVPLGSADPLHGTDRWLSVVARLRPAATFGVASAQMALATRAMTATQPAARKGAHAVARPLGMGPTETAAERGLMTAMFMSVPICILLIACANLANLILAQHLVRGRELAVRAALGASRGRIVRQLSIESGVVAGLGGAFGVALVVATGPVASAVGLELPAAFHPRWNAVAYTAAMTTLAALLFGVLPGLRASRQDPQVAMRGGAAGGATPRSRIRNALVIGQIALSVALVALTALFARSSAKGRTAEAGMALETMTLATVDLAALRTSAEQGAYVVAALTRLRALPGVERVGVADFVPLTSMGEERLTPGGNPQRGRWVRAAFVDSGFFAAAGVALRGGDLGAFERGEGIVASAETMAAVMAPASATGSAVRIGAGSGERGTTIVAIAGDVRIAVDRPAEPTIYRPLSELSSEGPGGATLTFVARSRAPASLVAPLRDALLGVDARVAPASVVTGDQHLARALGPWRMLATALGGFGVFALMLAGTGIFSVLAFVVSQRTFEIGVRRALGAPEGAIAGGVLRQALAFTAAGVLMGSALATALAVMLRSMLIGISPLDPLSYASTAATLCVVALVAAAVPTWRALRVDPLVALRAGG